MTNRKHKQPPQSSAALPAVAALTALTAVITIAVMTSWAMPQALLAGLFLFAAVFAINSALHSYLVVRYAAIDSVSQDVGFYYMANASGRLLGTVVSGWSYQTGGLVFCLQISCAFLLLASIASVWLPRADTSPSQPQHP